MANGGHIGMSDGVEDGVVHNTLGNTWHYSVGPTMNARKARGRRVAWLKMGLVGL
jgi:hypothetical protein